VEHKKKNHPVCWLPYLPFLGASASFLATPAHKLTFLSAEMLFTAT
jgi:hypothetical protein